jgi:hypothetical protein
MTDLPDDPALGARDQSVRVMALSLAIGGVFTVAVAIFLGATVDPVLYAIALLSLVDFGLAWAYGTGRVAPVARARRELEESGQVTEAAELDPSYNPYARED